MKRTINAIENLIFGNRRLVLVLFALVTLALGWSALQLRIDAGFSKLLPLEHEYMQAFTDYQEDFGGANTVLVALVNKEGQIFTPDFLETLRQATEDVFFIPGVQRSRVSSLWTPLISSRVRFSSNSRWRTDCDVSDCTASTFAISVRNSSRRPVSCSIRCSRRVDSARTSSIRLSTSTRTEESRVISVSRSISFRPTVAPPPEMRRSL